jgi:nucleoid DNA-binding protein
MAYKQYSPTYEKTYMRLSAFTGMSAGEIDVFMIKLVKVITGQLNRDGESLIPYLGKFYIKRVPARKRNIVDFSTEKRFTVKIPASDKLKFKVNRDFSKLFR